MDRLYSLVRCALSPIDNASITLYRIAFGFLMAGWCWSYLTTGRVTTLYVKPSFHFYYPGFHWIHPLPAGWMELFFCFLLVLSLLIAFGYRYRLVMPIFASLFTYVFLLERTNYQNHYYLLSLISWWMVFLPLNQNVSLDERSGRVQRSQRVPAWVLGVLRFHIAVPYVYGGLAKLTPDWLLGQPMGLFLSTKAELPVIGGLLAAPGMGIAFSWGGLLFDLLIVPCLMFRRTRTLAFILCIFFHLTNAVLFSIHVFPWFMIVASTLFFEPDWPRRVLGAPGLSTEEATTVSRDISGIGNGRQPSWAVLFAVGLYVLFHLTWPLRCRFYEGEPSWHERGHLFSWRMMLRAKEVGIGLAIHDPATGRVANVDHLQFLGTEQAEKFGRDPELIRQLAWFIADKFEAETGRRPEVHAFALASLNGRKPQLMIDPNTDLASVTASLFGPRPWVVPLEEPLRSPAWQVPMSEWRQHVELPEIDFLKRGPAPTGDSDAGGRLPVDS